ncbi:MAG: penicillin-binding protein 2 [Bacteroidota bacterium]
MDEARSRLFIFSLLVATVIGLLGARLVVLQLIETDEYAEESEKNSVQPRRMLPARGLVYDRNGTLMVSNEQTYSVTLTPRFFDMDKLPMLAELLDLPDSTVVAKIKDARAWSAYKPSTIFSDIPFETFSHLQESQFRLPGVNFVVDEKRSYHSAARAAHALGYIGEISSRQLDTRREAGYRMGDKIGKTGIEAVYEPHLRGDAGQRFMLVNVHGQEVKSWREGTQDVPPKSGYDLVLGIDAQLQAVAESLFVNKRGGAVAMDPNTGEILALVSAPDYNPALLAGTIDDRVWSGMNQDENKPLYNRATLSMQPPGSTWKPFMSLVGLQEGVISPETRIHCSGGFHFGRYYKCMGAHGSLTVADAIKKSCNTFYYTIMSRMKLDRWADWARAFGFGKDVPTDIPEQSRGLIPDSTYFNRIIGEGRWNLSSIAKPILGIGQGNMGVTPLQLARYVSAVANGGTLHAPHLIREMVDPETGERYTPELPASVQIPVDDVYWPVVQEGMRRMAMENNASARWDDVVVAGKTGTAQNPHGEDHAWFVSYAPFSTKTATTICGSSNGA